MEQCVTKAEFARFLELITVPWEKISEKVIVVHAILADTFWIWDGVHFCLLQGGVTL